GIEERALLTGLEFAVEPPFRTVLTSAEGIDRGVRFRDLDGDGRCELLVANAAQSGAFAWSDEKKAWELLPFAPPALVDLKGRDNGIRFVDVNEDGHDDLVISNEHGHAIALFESMRKGWSRWVDVREKNLPPIAY